MDSYYATPQVSYFRRFLHLLLLLYFVQHLACLGTSGFDDTQIELKGCHGYRITPLYEFDD